MTDDPLDDLANQLDPVVEHVPGVGTVTWRPDTGTTTDPTTAQLDPARGASRARIEQAVLRFGFACKRAAAAMQQAADQLDTDNQTTDEGPPP